MWFHIHMFSMFICIQICVSVCACVLVQVHVVYVFVYVCRLDGAHRVRRCCRALLTAAGNQSTLSVYSPTRRFLNDLP